MKTYLLTESAKSMTWQEWKQLGGCGLSDGTANALRMSPAKSPAITLGALQERCIVAGREIARFALDHLGLPNMAQVEYDITEVRKRIIRRDNAWIVERF